jgi:hypothetical protein
MGDALFDSRSCIPVLTLHTLICHAVLCHAVYAMPPSHLRVCA